MNRTLIPSLLLALSLLSCGGSTQATDDTTTPVDVDTQPAPPPFDPQAYFPQDTFAVVELKAQRLTGSPYFDTLMGWLRETGEMPDHQEQVFIDAIAATSDILVPMVDDDGEPEPGAVLFSGAFTHEQVCEWLRVAAEGEDIVPLEVLGHAACGEEGEAFIAQIADDWWILGPDEYVRPILQNPARPQVLDSPQWADVVSRIQAQDAAIEIISLATDEGLEMLVEDTPLTAELVDGMQAFAFAFDAMDGADAEATMLARDAAAAQSLAGFLNTQIGEIFGSLPARAMGLSGLAEFIQVEQRGADVAIRMNLPDAEVRSLLDRVHAFLQMSGAFGGDAEEPPAQAAPPQP